MVLPATGVLAAADVATRGLELGRLPVHALPVGIGAADRYHEGDNACTLLTFVDAENPSIRPKHISDKRLVEDTAGDYLYMAAIHFINSVKTGPFFEHSPILWNVSDLPTWQKINVGMTKMFQAEVLGKFPVMQHFWFGSLLRFA
jgi:hypothetical protein